MIIEENDLVHYGIKRRSGRYPWGSGDNAKQSGGDFLSYLDEMRKTGWTEVQIADSLGMSTKDLRASRTIAKNEKKAAEIALAQRLKEKGYSNVAIGKRLDKNESYVRTLLADGVEDRNNVLTTTANVLRKQVDEKRYLDVSSGTENYLGVSKEKKEAAIAMLLVEGYQEHKIKVPQLGTGKETTMKVLVAPDVTFSELSKNRDNIKFLTSYSDDGGRTFYGILPPLSISPARVDVRYKEDGGASADGVIYVRPGVPDVTLGGSRYAQVRIKVGDNHYIKGMALYKTDLPDGVDLVFNTNKSNTGNKLDAFKKFSDKPDPDNPFGSYIQRQLTVRDKDGKETLTSVMNIVNEEGGWADWSKTISTQVLSKQSPELAKTQLGMTYERRKQNFEEINSLTNELVKRRLLLEFADDSDSAATHLKAASLPRQGWQVILPVNSLRETEIYAPNFRDGERVALIRYPHGGTFEIPELTVNNKHPEAKNLLGQAQDAVGINEKVAAHLSGADFDGDTVLVIPNNSGKIRTSPQLQALKDFDPKASYSKYEGMKVLSEDRKQREMGDITNLITDMTIQGASHAEIARATKHSMVVIDAAKHELNYKQSAIDNGISQLKEKYQGGARKGASTIVSKAKTPVRIAERIPRRASKGGPIDKDTGEKVFELTGRVYRDKNGGIRVSTSKVPALSLVKDANELSSGTPMERIYAEHSNKLKALANEARRIAVNIKGSPRSRSAAQTYSKEVASLSGKLDLAIRNRPLERQAQILANAVIRQKLAANPDLDKETRNKIKFQALEEMRRRTGAKKTRIVVTQSEWDAIQAGAISESKLSEILANADMDVIKQFATPKISVLMSDIKVARATAMLKLGATKAEVADALGVSISTLNRSLI